MPDSIQPREHSRGGGTEDISRNSDGDPNLLGANRNDDGCWLNAYWDKPGNRWNRDNGFAFAVSQLSSFLPRFYGRVLFCELSIPAAKHSTSFVKFHGKRDIFFAIKRFGFPENHKKHAKSVHFFDCQPNIRVFFFARKKAGGRDCFYYFNK